MRVIIAGSRSINGRKGREAVKEAIKLSGWDITEVISGHAAGVDEIGEEIAKESHIDLVVFPANWKKHGKGAGFKRNKKMAWYASLFKDSPDERLKGGLIAVWNGTSGGTKNMIELAQKSSIPVFIHKVENFEDDEVDEHTAILNAEEQQKADALNGKS